MKKLFRGITLSVLASIAISNPTFCKPLPESYDLQIALMKYVTAYQAYVKAKYSEDQKERAKVPVLANMYRSYRSQYDHMLYEKELYKPVDETANKVKNDPAGEYQKQHSNQNPKSIIISISSKKLDQVADKISGKVKATITYEDGEPQEAENNSSRKSDESDETPVTDASMPDSSVAQSLLEDENKLRDETRYDIEKSERVEEVQVTGLEDVNVDMKEVENAVTPIVQEEFKIAKREDHSLGCPANDFKEHSWSSGKCDKCGITEDELIQKEDEMLAFGVTCPRCGKELKDDRPEGGFCAPCQAEIDEERRRAEAAAAAAKREQELAKAGDSSLVDVANGLKEGTDNLLDGMDETIKDVADTVSEDSSITEGSTNDLTLTEDSGSNDSDTIEDISSASGEDKTRNINSEEKTEFFDNEESQYDSSVAKLEKSDSDDLNGSMSSQQSASDFNLSDFPTHNYSSKIAKQPTWRAGSSQPRPTSRRRNRR